MSSNKILWISILQGWAMFLVVLGHCDAFTQYQWCKDVCYGVHMPLFMFVELILMKKMTEFWMQPLLVALSVLLGIYFPVVISKCVKRMDNKYYNMILGLK